VKNGNEFFMELSRCLFTEPYCNLSQNAKWLFVVLNELEQRYTGDNTDFFFRSNDDLANDANMSLSALKRTKIELVKTDLIEVWRMHFINKETGKKSEKNVTAYRILK